MVARLNIRTYEEVGTNKNATIQPVPQTPFQSRGLSPKLVTTEDGGGRDGLPFGAL